jgi:hypothetical protein
MAQRLAFDIDVGGGVVSVTAPPIERPSRSEATTEPVARARPYRLPAWWPLVTLSSAIALWIVSMASIDTRAIGALGFLSAAPATYYAAIAVAAIGIAFGLYDGARMRILFAHMAIFILIVHATPAIVYGTLRYAWAWRHIGIVDLLMRTHHLQPNTPVLPIYQSWPGFFAGATTLTEAAGLKSALSFAAWAPAFFELLDALALIVVFRALTDDRRRVALGVWFFLIANWVGQDYFAPQAFGFFLYLVVLAIVVRWFRAPSSERRRWQPRFSLVGAEPDLEPRPEVARDTRRAAGVLLIVIVAGIASSHPLTPFVLTVAMALLWFFRALKPRWPFLAVGGITAGWMVTGAHQYVFTQGVAIVSQFGQLGSNVNSNISSVGQMTHAQQLVANMGRMVVVGMALLAVAGFLRRCSFAHWDSDIVVLCAAPAAIFVGGSYGGEAVFRVFLFTLPFASFLAAGLFYTVRSSVTTWRTPATILIVSGVLISGFLFGYYGKEAWFEFQPSEVRAASIVFSTAPKNSNLVDGMAEFPEQFVNQERFSYTTIVNEPPQSRDAVLKDPVNVLYSWLSDPKYAQSYLIITRSQIAEADATGQLPKGSLQRIEQALLDSKRFTVLYHDHDAAVFTLGPTPVPAAGAQG